MKEGRRTYLFNVRVKARVSDQRLLTVMSIYMLICLRISLVCVCQSHSAGDSQSYKGQGELRNV